MKWIGRRESSNVEDRRGIPGGRPVLIGGGSLGGLILILVLIFCCNVNPLALLQQGGVNEDLQQQQAPIEQGTDDEAKNFVKVVLADTEDVWNEQFRKMGKRYREPRLVLFRGRVESACGLASAASGPFYCPEDEHLYIDLTFFDELKRRYRAPGDFAQAYVIAHEVGHHVQNLLGTTDLVQSQRSRLSKADYNHLSVCLELQADFLAGVWAHHAQKTKQILEPGDIDEALSAANAIGDDRLQRQSQGYIVPDSFTHGTSAQRMYWFKRGFQTGDLSKGDTFREVER